MNILLTRPLNQVKNLQKLVLDSNNKPILFPTLLTSSIASCPVNKTYDVVIFISVNAVDYGIKILKNINYSKIFAVGGATARKLIKNHIIVDDFPRTKPSSESLLSIESVSKLASKNILIFRGKGGRETLKNGLTKNSNTVEYLEVYQRNICQVSDLHKKSIKEFFTKKSGFISITSIDSLKALLDIVNKIDNEAKLKTYPLIVFSQRIKEYALKIGFKKIFITSEMSDKGIVEAISSHS